MATRNDEATSGRNIDANIALVRTNATALNELIQTTALDILKHAQTHKDCSRAQHLLNAMPRSFRRSILIEWFATFSPIVVKDSDDWNSKMHKPDSKLYRPFDLEGAAAKPWYEMAEDKPEKTYDFAALVKMVERLGSVINKKIEDGKVPEADVESAKAIVAKVTALRFDRIKEATGKGLVPVTEATEVDNDGNVINLPDPEVFAA